MFGGTGIDFFAALHYWFPKMFGKMYNMKIANIGCCYYFVGFQYVLFTNVYYGLYGNAEKIF